MNHGLLFSVGDDAGPKVRLPLDDVLLIHTYVHGQAADPNAAHAEELLAAALKRRDEVRHWVVDAVAASAVAAAIDAALAEGRPLSPEASELRQHLPG